MTGEEYVRNVQARDADEKARGHRMFSPGATCAQCHTVYPFPLPSSAGIDWVCDRCRAPRWLEPT